MNTLKTIVILPAYNAAATLQKTIRDLPFDHIDEIVLVDDVSKDFTVALAKNLASAHPILTLSAEEYARNPKKVLFTITRHEKNRGYGGNQKSCYRIALDHGADIIVMVHPDYQYDPKLVKHMVEFIREGYFDVMLGSRIRTRREALAGGMPAYKYFANRALTLMQNVATGQVLSEWHTGMRAYRREVLEDILFERFSDDFVFDTQALFAIAERGYSIGDIPVPVRYFKEASSINFTRSTQYGLLTVWETGKYVVRNMPQLLRYLVAGGLATATNLLLYAVLLYIGHIPYTVAASIAFFGGAVTSFLLQKYWTFKQASLKRVPYEILLYVALVIVNNFINTSILFYLVQELLLGKFVANIISNGMVAVWSYFIYKHITFRAVKNV